MRRFLSLTAVVVAIGGFFGGVAVWRRNRRLGSGFVNRVVNPLLLERGLAGRRASEIGTLEHVGRRTGRRRLTPVHPEATANGFRIMVPLAEDSEWARNVLAAGHCRLQLHDRVYELDEPVMVAASRVGDLPEAVRRVAGWLGFDYLELRQFAVAPGALEPVASDVPRAPQLDADRTPASPVPTEGVPIAS